MEEHLHDQHMQKGESYYDDGSSTSYAGVGKTMGPSKQILSNLTDKKNTQHEKHSKDHKDLQIKDNFTLDNFYKETFCQKCLKSSVENLQNVRHICTVDINDVSDNAKNDDVLVRETQNGCDKSLFDQKHEIFILPAQLENIRLNATSSECALENPNNETKDSNNLEASGDITTCTTTFYSSNAMFPQCTQNAIRSTETEKCESEKASEKGPTDSQRLDETHDTLGTMEAKRGKNIAQSITKNISTNGTHESNSNNYTGEINHQTPLKLACQFPYLTVLPLHACNMLSHSHHKLLNIHYYQNHYSQHESEKFANELTNALSSRLLFQISNNSFYSALKSQAKRQNSFLKSQSLEIVLESPSIINHATNDDHEQLFFQMPEINKDDQQYYQLTQQGGNPQQLHAKDISNTRSNTTNVSEIQANEGKTITRSLSLSSQKTGIALKTQSLESRPIYPNVPYSPYASPYSSPRTNRRKPPLRESRRVSIEQTGSFLQLNQYKLMDQIGQGSYGLVKLAYSEEDSTHYAMKILSKRRLLRQAGLMKRGPKKTTSPLDRVYREIAVLKKLDHPNVVKLIEVLDDPLDDSLYMVFELVKQGEVLSVPTKNPLSEERAWSVFRDTILGLEYLHYQRIIHADIKPGNLLLTECGRVKIADLGVCNEFIGENATMTNGSTAGTPAFRAPESLNEGQNIYCGKAADIWALGATLYALVYGNVPFVASSVPSLYEKIKSDELSFPEIPKTSAELRSCIQSILKKNPAERITLPQLKEHTWVTAGGLYPLPSEEENCRLVQVNDEDINSVVRSIPKLDTLILIKTMLKKHSFGNPFSRGISGRAPQRGGSRLERFIRAGRSNSAPGSYNMIIDRQLSGDNILPALCEHSTSSCLNEES